MEKKLFISCVKRLHRVQAIYLTFMNRTGNEPGLQELLRARYNVPGVIIENSYMLNLVAVAESGRWERVSRTVPVYGLAYTSNESLELIACSLESVSAGEHYAKALFTSNKHRQLAAQTKIIGEVLNKRVLDGIQEFGLNATAKLIDIDGIQALEFSIVADSAPVVQIRIDGFSGRMQIKGKWGDVRFSEPTQIQDILLAELEAYLELATQPG